MGEGRLLAATFRAGAVGRRPRVSVGLSASVRSGGAEAAHDHELEHAGQDSLVLDAVGGERDDLPAVTDPEAVLIGPAAEPLVGFGPEELTEQLPGGVEPPEPAVKLLVLSFRAVRVEHVLDRRLAELGRVAHEQGVDPLHVFAGFAEDLLAFFHGAPDQVELVRLDGREFFLELPEQRGVLHCMPPKGTCAKAFRLSPEIVAFLTIIVKS